MKDQITDRHYQTHSEWRELAIALARSQAEAVLKDLKDKLKEAELPRQVLFQEDNNGAGPSVEEVHFLTGPRRVGFIPLNVETLDRWIAEGATEIFLAYRGGWEPHKLYR